MCSRAGSLTFARPGSRRWLCSVSVPAWQQTVAVTGTTLLMVLALGFFWILARIDGMSDAGSLPARGWFVALGVTGGLLFLTEYSAGVLIFVGLVYVARIFHTQARGWAVALVCIGFVVVSGPWVGANLALTGNPVALAAQNVALKFGDSTAEPSNQRALLKRPPQRWTSTSSAQSPVESPGKPQIAPLVGWGNVADRFFCRGVALCVSFPVGRSPALDVYRGAGGDAGRAGGLQFGRERAAGPVLDVAADHDFWRRLFFRAARSHATLGAWPRVGATVLLVIQALPLAHDLMEPRRLHFNYPPYFPALFIGMGHELERRDATGRFGMMADVPAGVAWYGRQRVWAQPVRIKDFYAITLEQPIGELLLTPPRWTGHSSPSSRRVRHRRAASSRLNRFGDWGRSTEGCSPGRFPRSFPSVRRSVWPRTSM